jgi:hypothetical protein
MQRGLPCSNGMLGFTAHDECCPPSSSAIAGSFSSEKPPMMTVPTCDDTGLINSKDSNWKLD